MSGFGGTIKLKGEETYKKALRDIRQSLRETGSGLTAISSSFQNSAKDMNAATKSAKNLKDLFDQQKKAAENLKSVYDNLLKIFESNKKEIEKLKKEFENAKKELEKIEKEVGKTSKVYKDQAEAVKKLEQNLEKAIKRQDDNKDALSKVRTELNNSETAISKTRGEWEKLEKVIEKNKKTAENSKSAYESLKKVIEGQEKTLKGLKDEYKEVILKEGETSKAAKDLADKIKDLSGKLEDNKKKLKDADDAAEKLTGGLNNTGDAAEKSSGKFETFKTALGNFVSNIALRAIDKLKEMAVGAFNVGRAFEYSMSKVKAISGANDGEFTNLRKQAIELGKGTIFSSRETAEAMKYMAIAGWRANEILAGLRPTLDLAAASGEDLAQVSDILTDGMTAFGMSAKDAKRFADVLATAAINSNTDVGKMGETFKYVAPLANALGYSIEDTAIAIGTMADSSIKASIAGTSLRSIFSRLASNMGASKNQLGALDVLTKKLGVAFYDSSGKTRPFLDVLRDAREAWKKLSQQEQISYAKTIAGQKAMAGWLTLMNTAPEKFNQVTDSILNSSGTAQRVATEMTDNVEGDIKRFNSSIEAAQIELSKKLEPTTRSAIKVLSKFADVLSFISEHSTEFTVALASITAGIGTFLIITQGATIVTTLTTAIQGLWAVIEANPIGAAISLVVALIVAFIVLWKNSKEFRDFWTQLWEDIKEDWEDTKQLAKDFFEPFKEDFEDLRKGVNDLDKEIDKGMSRAVEKNKENLGKIGGFFSDFFKGIGKGSEKVYEEMDKMREEDRRKNKDSLEKTGKFFSEFFGGIGKSSEKAYEEMGKKRDENRRKNKENLEKTGKLFSEFFEKVKKGAGEAWEKIKEAFGKVKEYFKEKFSDAWKAIKEVFSGWGKFFGELWDKIKTKFSELGTKIGNAVGSAVKSAINYVIRLIESKINSAINLINGAIRLINMIPGVEIDEVDHLRLPRLAKGGVLENGARTVIAGEDGAEAIVPLEKNTKWISLVANQLQRQMIPQLSSNTDAYSEMRAQTEFNSLVNSFKQALSEMKVVMDEETFGKFVDRTVSDAIYD